MEQLFLQDSDAWIELQFMRQMQSGYNLFSTLPFYHDSMEIMMVLDGNPDFYCGSNHLHLKPGDIIFMTPETLHVLNYAEHLNVLFFHIPRENLDRFSLKENARYHIAGCPEVLPHIMESVALITRLPAGDNIRNCLCASLCFFFRCLFTDLLQKFCQDFTIFEENELAKDIFSYINTHFSESICIASLMKKYSVSSSYLTRLVAAYCNSTPMEVLTRSRIYHASILLIKTDLSITEISKTCGYTNFVTFQKAFRRSYDFTPSHFRKYFKEKCSSELNIRLYTQKSSGSPAPTQIGLIQSDQSDCQISAAISSGVISPQ